MSDSAFIRKNSSASTTLPSATRTNSGAIRMKSTTPYVSDGTNWAAITRVFTSSVASPATAATIFVATRPVVLKAVSSVYSTKATAASQAYQLYKDTGTTAPAGGTALLTAALDLSGTANTVHNGSVVTTAATITLAAGDRISILATGTPDLTGLVGLCTTLELQPIV